MKSKMLIGLSGDAGSGKDFAAQVIRSVLPKMQVVSFAKPVYELSALLLGVSVPDLERRLTKEQFFFVEITNTNLSRMVDYLAEVINRVGAPCDARSEIYEWLLYDVAKHYRAPETMGTSVDSVMVLRISPRKVLELVGTELGRNRVQESVWLDLVEAKYNASPAGIVITDVRFPNEDLWVKQQCGVRIDIDAPNSKYAIKSTHASASHKFKVDITLTNNYDENFEADILSSLL